MQTFENETEELVHISVSNDEIVTTPKHPFYVPHKGWTSAVDLRAGDILVLLNGEYVIVEKVQHEILESPVKVYNFEVRDFHTYYVGENSVLVHNDCHQMTGTVQAKDGSVKREPQIYKSGGGSGRLNQQQALLTHTERKFLYDLDGFDFAAGDTIIMSGTKSPCKPGCQPAIRDFVSTNNVNAVYYASEKGLTFSWSPFSDDKLKGDVLQQVFNTESGELLGSWRYWRTPSGHSSRAVY